MSRDFETLYYEQQAEHTEARGMLAQERDHWKKKADELDAECGRLTNCLAKGTLWIPVSERMPERDTPVLVWLDARRWGPLQVAALNFDDFEGSEDWCIETPLGITPIKTVTHWMPLPEAPK